MFKETCNEVVHCRYELGMVMLRVPCCSTGSSVTSFPVSGPSGTQRVTSKHLLERGESRTQLIYLHVLFYMLNILIAFINRSHFCVCVKDVTETKAVKGFYYVSIIGGTGVKIGNGTK